MYSLAFIIPYFGKMREDLNIWLQSVRYNPTIDWIILTDDRTQYDYPPNVRIVYTSFLQVKRLIQDTYDFAVELNDPYKLVDFKSAYGEIFKKELASYDFWGHCDMDLMWGDIRKFITDEILDTYDKIGFQGHSTIYRNTPINNVRYRTYVENKDYYKNVFTSSKTWNFDEKAINAIYNYLEIPFYSETNFSTLAQYRHNFVARYWPKDKSYRNKRVVYLWENGKLYNVSAYKGELYYDEIMYVHWQKRKMVLNCQGTEIRYLIIPNTIISNNEELQYAYVYNVSKAKWLSYFRFLIKQQKGKGIISLLRMLKKLIVYNNRVIFNNHIKQDLDG